MMKMKVESKRHVRTRTRMCGRWTTDGGLGIACSRTRSSVTPARGLCSSAAGERRAIAWLVLCCSCGTACGDLVPVPRLRAWGQGARDTARFPPLWQPLSDKASQGGPLHLRGGEQRGGGPRPSHQRQRHSGSGGGGGGGGRSSKWQTPVPLYSIECETPDYRPEAEDASTCKAAIARMGRHKC